MTIITSASLLNLNISNTQYLIISKNMKLSEKTIRLLPKVLLHDHLDGGLRPQTVIDLAQEIGYDKLPTDDADELNEWFQRGAKRGSLPLYLERLPSTPLPQR